LFYRLNVIPIFLPPLRDRKQDLQTLVGSFVNRFNKEHSKKIVGVAPEAMQCLLRYSWPGNIRELENVIEHAFVLEDTNRITLKALPDKVLGQLSVNDLIQPKPFETPSVDVIEADDEVEIEGAPLEGVPAVEGDLDFNKQKETFEKDFIIMALKKFRGRINQTALHANIPKKTLLRKIEKYGINPKEYSV
jgi:two-component system, NtrC family, response regulator HydG